MKTENSVSVEAGAIIKDFRRASIGAIIFCMILLLVMLISTKLLCYNTGISMLDVIVRTWWDGDFPELERNGVYVLVVGMLTIAGTVFSFLVMISMYFFGKRKAWKKAIQQLNEFDSNL